MWIEFPAKCSFLAKCLVSRWKFVQGPPCTNPGRTHAVPTSQHQAAEILQRIQPTNYQRQSASSAWVGIYGFGPCRGVLPVAVAGLGVTALRRHPPIRPTLWKGSFFEKNSLDLITIVKLIFMWVIDTPQNITRLELALSKKTVIDWFNFCRDECQRFVAMSVRGLSPTTTISCIFFIHSTYYFL